MQTYHKILINLAIWHLKPYRITRDIQGNRLTEVGFLCFKYIYQESEA